MNYRNYLYSTLVLFLSSAAAQAMQSAPQVSAKDVPPLIRAIASRKQDEAIKLIREGRGINEREKTTGMTPLMVACYCNNHELVDLLLGNRNLDLNAITHLGESALTFAVKSADAGLICELLLYNAKHQKAIFTAAEHNRLAALEALLSIKTRIFNITFNKVNINEQNADGDTALIIACRKGHAKFVQELVCKKAAVDKANNKKQTPLMIAASHGYFAIVQHLCAKGASLDLCDAAGKSALVYAAENNYTHIVRLLMQYGASIGDYQGEQVLDGLKEAGAAKNWILDTHKKAWEEKRQLWNRVKTFISSYSPSFKTGRVAAAIAASGLLCYTMYKKIVKR